MRTRPPRICFFSVDADTSYDEFAIGEKVWLYCLSRLEEIAREGDVETLVCSLPREGLSELRQFAQQKRWDQDYAWRSGKSTGCQYARVIVWIYLNLDEFVRIWSPDAFIDIASRATTSLHVFVVSRRNPVNKSNVLKAVHDFFSSRADEYVEVD